MLQVLTLNTNQYLIISGFIPVLFIYICTYKKKKKNSSHVPWRPALRLEYHCTCACVCTLSLDNHQVFNKDIVVDVYTEQMVAVA